MNRSDMKSIPRLIPHPTTEEEAAKWYAARGWWIADGTIECVLCRQIVADGAPIYVHGTPDDASCEGHTPRKLG